MSTCTRCGKWNGAHATLPGQPRDHLCHCQPADSVKVPTNADEAALMVLLGMDWLKNHAPERIKPEQATPAKDMNSLHCALRFMSEIEQRPTRSAGDMQYRASQAANILRTFLSSTHPT